MDRASRNAVTATVVFVDDSTRDARCSFITSTIPNVGDKVRIQGVLFTISDRVIDFDATSEASPTATWAMSMTRVV